MDSSLAMQVLAKTRDYINVPTIRMKIHLILLCFCFLPGCNNGKEVQPKSSFKITVPLNLASDVPQPNYNQATEKGIMLGRMLFYDPLLSGNNTMSCAGCHHLSNGFSDTLPYSRGENGNYVLRNTPPLFNLAWYTGYFWDGGAKNLESQVFGPLQSADEMNQDLNELVAELRQHPKYPTLFSEVFSEDSISSAQVAQAIAQFERSIISGNSRYDKYVRKEENSFSEIEIKGLQLFTEKCAGCHEPDFFTDFGYHNNGLDSSFEDANHENVHKGRYRITNDQADLGKYKTPSLRNIKLTAPYMHDGRFKSIEEVIEHYSNGIVSSPTLDPSLRFESNHGFNFTQSEKNSLILFLNTLTDYDFVTKTSYANPF